jgi:hypothetical protein
VKRTSAMANATHARTVRTRLARGLPIAGNPYLRNTYLQTVEPPRTHDPKSPRDLLKGGIVLQETQGGRGRVVADAWM